MRKRSPKEKGREIIKDTRREDATKDKRTLNEKEVSNREETRKKKGLPSWRRDKTEGDTK